MDAYGKLRINDRHPFHMEMQMDFYKKMRLVCLRIPAGTVATYGQIALLCGSPNHARPDTLRRRICRGCFCRRKAWRRYGRRTAGRRI